MKARVVFGEEPSHFLNMMGGDFITLQVKNDIVVTVIITAWPSPLSRSYSAIFELSEKACKCNNHISQIREVLRERSPPCRTMMG